MKNQKKAAKTKTQYGLFMFFVFGLFMLQIIFAFTIHGDIGPHSDAVPCIDKPASPFLVGRVDTLVSNAKMAVSKKVAPEGAFSPASREITDEKISLAHIAGESSQETQSLSVQKTEEERFYTYQIRPGDTLDKISRKLYGSGRMVQSLIRLNRIADDRSLRLGANLLVPRNGILDTVKVL